MQAQDNVLFSGKIEEYEAAFDLVDTEKKGEGDFYLERGTEHTQARAARRRTCSAQCYMIALLHTMRTFFSST